MFRPRLADGQLYFKPRLELELILPDGLHRLAGVSVNHGGYLSMIGRPLSLRLPFSERVIALTDMGVFKGEYRGGEIGGIPRAHRTDRH